MPALKNDDPIARCFASPFSLSRGSSKKFVGKNKSSPVNWNPISSPTFQKHWGACLEVALVAGKKETLSIFGHQVAVFPPISFIPRIAPPPKTGLNGLFSPVGLQDVHFLVPFHGSSWAPSLE